MGKYSRLTVDDRAIAKIRVRHNERLIALSAEALEVILQAFFIDIGNMENEQVEQSLEAIVVAVAKGIVLDNKRTKSLN